MSHNTDSADLSVYGASVSSIKQIPELEEVEDRQNLHTIRIMHSFDLTSMQGIEIFTGVTELNLSSNSIEKMEGLNRLTKLRMIDLSCNRIRKIDGLSNLKQLEKLILTSNRISSLQPLSQVFGDEYSLEYLDVKDNKLASIGEIKYLGGITHLREVFLTSEDETNPQFQDIGTYISSLRSLPNFKNLQRVDGKDITSLVESAKENINGDYNEEGEEYEDCDHDNEHSIDEIKTPYKNMRSSTAKKSVLQEVDMNRNLSSKMKSTAKKQPSEMKELERYYEQQIRGLHEKLEMLYQDQSELIHKFEMNEKYWSNKCGKLEETMRELQQENRDVSSQNMKMRTTIDGQKEELDRIHKELSGLKSKKDKKEDLIDEQQRRISDLLRENGELNRELSMRAEEIGNLKSDLGITEGMISELKGIIRNNERSLNELHSQALQNNSVNIQRSEDLQRKFDELEKETQEKSKEIRKLNERNLELEENVLKWEKKLEEKVSEVLRSEQSKLRLIENDYKEKIEDLERTHEKEIMRCDDRFKESMDMMEEEFKKVLLESNDKFKTLKAAYDEKTRLEAELKQILQVIGAKNSELERLLHDQTIMMKSMKEEYINLLQDRESATKSAEEKVNVIKADMSTHQEVLDKLRGEKEVLEKRNEELEEQAIQRTKEMTGFKRRIAELESGNESIRAEIEKWKNRAIIAEEKNESEEKRFREEIEDLKDNMETKNRMLEDKNLTIDELKEQLTTKQEEIEFLKNTKNDTQEFEEEIRRQRHHNEKLQKKVDKASDYISEMKKGIGELEEELTKRDETIANLEAQLEKKNQTLNFIEQEIGHVKEKQDGDLKEKEKRINDLESLLDECSNTLLRKKEVQSKLEEQLRNTVGEFEGALRIKDREIMSLKGQLSENEEEMKLLVQEVQRERNQAKENIAKLQLLFK